MIDMAFITQLNGSGHDKWFYRLIKDGSFPAPIKPGRSSRWLKSERKPRLQARIVQSRPVIPDRYPFHRSKGHDPAPGGIFAAR